MTTKVHAIYRNGIFTPDQPLPIVEGADVELIVSTQSANGLAGALEEIAALPPEGPKDGFSGADHDAVLYGKRASK